MPDINSERSRQIKGTEDHGNDLLRCDLPQIFGPAVPDKSTRPLNPENSDKARADSAGKGKLNPEGVDQAPKTDDKLGPLSQSQFNLRFQGLGITSARGCLEEHPKVEPKKGQ